MKELFFLYLSEILFFINYNYFLAIFFYFIFLFIYSSLSLPGLLIFFVISGYLFGVYFGFLISIISITLGSFVFYIVSKLFFKNYLYKYFRKYTKNINKFISVSTIEYLIIFRMIPGPPLMVQNFILSSLNISKKIFIFSSLIGFIPYVFISNYFGNKINNIQKIKDITTSDIITWDLLIFILLIIILLILRIRFKK